MRPLILVPIAALVLPGCGGAAGLTTNAERIPGNGAAGGPGEAALKVQTLTTKDWARFGEDKLAPTCAGANVDAKQLEDAKKHIDAWAAWRKAHPRAAENNGVTVGDLAGVPRDYTERIDTLDFKCGAGATLAINGASFAFESAFALVNAPAGTTQVEILAISMTEKKIVYAALTLPTAADLKQNPKSDAKEVILVNNVGGYLPGTADATLVRNDSSKDTAPKFEVFVTAKGATEGFYYVVPVSSLSLKEPYNYLGVGKFRVSDD
jgi:hypothetical protein